MSITVNDILFKMNISSVLYIIVLVVCSLSGIQGQNRINPTEEEGNLYEVVMYYILNTILL